MLQEGGGQGSVSLKVEKDGGKEHWQEKEVKRQEEKETE